MGRQRFSKLKASDMPKFAVKKALCDLVGQGAKAFQKAFSDSWSIAVPEREATQASPALLCPDG